MSPKNCHLHVKLNGPALSVRRQSGDGVEYTQVHATRARSSWLGRQQSIAVTMSDECVETRDRPTQAPAIVGNDEDDDG